MFSSTLGFNSNEGAQDTYERTLDANSLLCVSEE